MNPLPISTQQLNFNGTTDSFATLGGVQRIILRTTADVWVMFDTPVNTQQAYKVLAANTADTEISLSGGNIQKLHALGAGGSGTLYIIAMVN